MIDIRTLKPGDKVRILANAPSVDDIGMRQVGLTVGGYGYVLYTDYSSSRLIPVGPDPTRMDDNGVTAWNFYPEQLEYYIEPYDVKDWSID